MTSEMESAPYVPNTFAELLEQLGDVPPERVWVRPYPGTATVDDVLAARQAPEGYLCELIDGVLVEKTVGAEESLLAAILIELLSAFANEHDLGLVLSSDGALQILPDQVRVPDVAFISWDKLPQGKLPPKPIPDLVPDLAVEVLSKGNTKKEMKRKIREYFLAGVKLVWVIDPKTRTAKTYRSAIESRPVSKTQALLGEDVVPGFRLPLNQLFARTTRKKKK